MIGFRHSVRAMIESFCRETSNIKRHQFFKERMFTVKIMLKEVEPSDDCDKPSGIVLLANSFLIPEFDQILPGFGAERAKTHHNNHYQAIADEPTKYFMTVIFATHFVKPSVFHFFKNGAMTSEIITEVMESHQNPKHMQNQTWNYRLQCFQNMVNFDNMPDLAFQTSPAWFPLLKVQKEHYSVEDFMLHYNAGLRIDEFDEDGLVSRWYRPENSSEKQIVYFEGSRVEN